MLQTPWFREEGEGLGRKKSTAVLPESEEQYLRFRRHSGLGSGKMEGSSMSSMLCLCRVLVLHLKTVDGPITTEEVKEAMQMHYDTIYSTSEEEYVLLQPNFVLPEFFMQVQSPPSPNQLPPPLDVGRSLPMMLQTSQQGSGDRITENNCLWDLLVSNLHQSEESIGSSPSSPRHSLMRKQSLVVSLQQAVGDFRRLRDSLLRKHQKAADKLLR